MRRSHSRSKEDVIKMSLRNFMASGSALVIIFSKADFRVSGSLTGPYLSVCLSAVSTLFVETIV